MLCSAEGGLLSHQLMLTGYPVLSMEAVYMNEADVFNITTQLEVTFACLLFS